MAVCSHEHKYLWYDTSLMCRHAYESDIVNIECNINKYTFYLTTSEWFSFITFLLQINYFLHTN